MTVHFVFPKLPPAPDAIGEHTALLAAAASAHVPTKVWTAQDTWAPVPGAAVARGFSIDERAGVRALEAAVGDDGPDWLVLQYNPFSYGNRGFNPYLAPTLARLRRRHPGLRLALLVHEIHPPVLNARLAVMTSYQLVHFARLCRLADAAFFTIEPWMDRYGGWFRRGVPIGHLPVGSNIPDAGAARGEMRSALGVAADTVLVGVFGTAHVTRQLGFVRAAAERMRAQASSLEVLYIGPDGDAVRQALAGLPVRDAGRRPAEEVSRHFAAMDVYLTPFRGGVSTRRGSFLVALQHGVPTATTTGAQTGPLLRRAAGHAFVAAPDDAPEAFADAASTLLDAGTARPMGTAARTLYHASFDWDRLAERLVGGLSDAPARTVS